MKNRILVPLDFKFQDLLPRVKKERAEQMKKEREEQKKCNKKRKWARESQKLWRKKKKIREEQKPTVLVASLPEKLLENLKKVKFSNTNEFSLWISTFLHWQ